MDSFKLSMEALAEKESCDMSKMMREILKWSLVKMTSEFLKSMLDRMT